MKFKSKSALWEHIIMLRDAGYLVEKQLTEPLPNGKIRFQRVYAVDFESVNKREDG